MILHLGELLHVTYNNVDSIPGSALDFRCGIHDLLYQEASIKALSVSVIEVDGRGSKVVVKMHVGLENIIRLLLHCEKLLRREKSCLRSGWEILITPGRTVGVSITVVLML